MTDPTEHAQAPRQRRRRTPSRQGYAAAPTAPAPWAAPEAPTTYAGIALAPVPTGPVFWPIRTRLAEGREVAFKGVSGTTYGRPGRRFMASRDGGRYHVGLDLFGAHRDLIVACEDGVIVNEYPFYHGTNALFVACDSGVVINYGEIEPKSTREFGHSIGSRVEAGQPLARVGKMKVDSMCHFETYRAGTTSNQRHYRGQTPPAGLLDPTAYLVHLAGAGG